MLKNFEGECDMLNKVFYFYYFIKGCPSSSASES